MYVDERGGMSSLIAHVLQTAGRHAELLDIEPTLADLDDIIAWADGASADEPDGSDVLIFDNKGQAKLSILLAESLIAMSENVHSADDRAVGGCLTRAKAEMYVKMAGSLRKAARLTGVPRMTLWRAIHQEAVA